MTEIEGSRDN